MTFNKMFFVVFSLLAAFGACKEKKKEDGAPAAVPSPIPDPGAGTSGGIDTTPSSPAKTKAQCNGEGTSWIAVVNGGQSPSACGSPLAPWGCCRSQVLARFASLATDLAQRIDQKTGEGFQLYNCSTAAEKSHKLHFARFPGDGKTEYYEITIDAFAYEPTGTVESCPQIPDVQFPDPSTISGGTTSTTTPTPGAGGSTTTLLFSDINTRIIKLECAASGCHGTANTGPNLKVYEDNEANVKANKTSILSRINLQQGQTGVMPPARALSFADKQDLTNFLNQP